MEPTSAIQAIVHGRVQGVGFRYYTVHTAQRIGVRGWVRNNRDGSVEVYAEGSEEQVAEIEAFLRNGSPHAHVVDVDVRRPRPTGTYRSFSIDY
jgi:acylphosphatase